jgi:hypothetical protein
MPNQVTRYECKSCQVEYHTSIEAESCEAKTHGNRRSHTNLRTQDKVSPPSNS